MSSARSALAVGIIGAAGATTFFKETFESGWTSRWTPSTAKPEAERGAFVNTGGKSPGVPGDKGIQTSEDARFYMSSAPLTSSFSNKDSDLIISYTVKHEQELDCGGAYIKLLGGGDSFDAAKFGGDTPYQIMFGPDVCGSSNRKTHVIFNYPPKNDNLLIKEEVKTETDKASHLYTLLVRPDNSFEVFIDEESVRSGKLEEAFDFLVPKEIKDPKQSKPSDWVDEKTIADPEDKKPAGYDDIPESIPDPDASKPEDWDNEEDGEWEPPLIDNPAYKGVWKAKQIDNPAYKGEWVHPMIPNPDYVEDKKLHVRCKDCTHIGFELWQVKTGTIFDDIIVTDSLEEAKAYAAETYHKKKGPEKEALEAHEAEEKKKNEAAEPKTDDKEDSKDEEEEHDEL